MPKSMEPGGIGGDGVGGGSRRRPELSCLLRGSQDEWMTRSQRRLGLGRVEETAQLLNRRQTPTQAVAHRFDIAQDVRGIGIA